MSNYEYIISSLPFLTLDYQYAEGTGFASTVEEIRRDLSEGDSALVDFLLKGFDDSALDADFYAAALRHRNRFIREYFRFDLNLRNAKVRYLNAQLGREADLDVMTGLGAEEDSDVDIDGYRFRGGEFPEEAKVSFVLSQDDLVTREKGIDEITWEKINDLTVFNYFDIHAILGYLAKLHIADRWLVLDEETGRTLFRQLVKEVKGTFKGVKYDE